MINKNIKREARIRRHARVRKNVSGTLNKMRSNKDLKLLIYVLFKNYYMGYQNYGNLQSWGFVSWMYILNNS